MQSRTILSGASATGLFLGLLLGATVPTRILPIPEPGWRKMPRPAPVSQASYQFVDAGPMDLAPVPYDASRPRRNGWAESAVRDLERNHLAAVEQAYQRRYDSVTVPRPAQAGPPDATDAQLPPLEIVVQPEPLRLDAVADIPALID